MKIEIKVPAMGESISEGTVGSILKPSGSKVETDDEIIELETDKVNQVLYAPQAGILQLNVAPQQTVKIGQVIGFIETEAGAKIGQEEKKEVKPPKESEILAETPQLTPAALPPKEKKLSVEPAKGEEGAARISKEAYLADITAEKKGKEAVAPEPKEPLAQESMPKSKEQRESRKKLSKVRRVIGDRLVEVLKTTAMLTTFNEIDMSQIIALRDKYKEPFTKKYGVKLGFLSFFVKAVVSALKEYPNFNSYIEGDELVQRNYYHIGIAVGTDRGLFVPVIKDCDKLTFAEIEKTIEGFAAKAREGTISVDELQGGGFTITNGGVYGSLLSTPILNPPQCGILGMHKIEKRPVVIDDQMVIRPMMYLALSYDHRIVDGKEAVSFLVHIKNRLEEPARQLLEI